VDYLKKAFWPVDLAVMYPLPVQTSVAKTLLAILVLVGITIGVGVLSRKRLWLTVGWLWFLGTLVPVIGLVQVGDQGMADRYAYVPLLGIFVACVWLVADLKNRFKVPMSAVALVIFLLLGVLAADARHQLAYWRDSVSLFSRALEVGGSSYTVESNFASALDE